MSAIDARGAQGVQVTEQGTQINYFYRGTATDGVAPPPLITVSGLIDSPYRGLAAFEERDAPFFFGREAITTEVLDRMSQCLADRMIVVVSGVSGAGKSSLLRAGVIPRIRGAGLASAPGSAAWPCLVFTPGAAPLDALAVRTATLARTDAATVRRVMRADPSALALVARQAALAQPGPIDRRLLLVVDQFEQIFRCSDEEQRAFVTALHAVATVGHEAEQIPAAMVVLAVRSDFEGRCADHPELTEAVKARYLVTAMTRRQLRMAITEPAAQAGSRVEEPLVEALLEEVGTRVGSSAGTVTGAGVLPLLSHALDQAWRGRSGDNLTLADYERIGGIEGAVTESAQRAYERLTVAQKALAKRIFLRLTTTGGDGTDIARRAERVELQECADDPRDVTVVLESFVADRLLTLAADSVEISHEVLLTAWPLLRETWLGETRAERLARSRLRASAAEWARHGRDSSYVYRGRLLDAAEDSLAGDSTRLPTLTETEQDFLDAGRRVRRRAVLRRRGFTAFLAAVALGLGIATYVAVDARQEALHQRDAAAADQLALKSRTETATDPVLGRLESLAAWRIDPSARSRHAMLVAASRPDLATLTGHRGWVMDIAYSPDGRMMASAGVDNTIRLWDTTTHAQIGAPLQDGGVVATVAFSPDGRTVASGGFEDKVRLWDVASHNEIAALPIAASYTKSVAFSPDGAILAVAGNDGSTWLWQIATRRRVARLLGHNGTVQSVAFSPDGRILVTCGNDGTVRLWDARHHRQLGAPLVHGRGSLYELTFSRDGRTLAVAGKDHTLRLWNMATRHETADLSGDAGEAGEEVNGIAFSGDGRTLAAATSGAVRLWDVSTRTAVGAMPVTTPVSALAFSPDAKTLATADRGATIRLWNVRTQAMPPVSGHTGSVNTVAYSPDGRTVATAGDDHTVQLWDLRTQRRTSRLTGHTRPVTYAAFSPDGRRLATTSLDGSVRLWDVATNRQTASVPVERDVYYSVSFTPDSQTLAIVGKGVLLWDIRNGRPTPLPDLAKTQFSTPAGDGGGPSAVEVAYSPDGTTLAVAAGDDVLLWDTASRRQIAKLTGHLSTITALAFSPDGTTLVTGSSDQTARLWSTTTHTQIGSTLAGHDDSVHGVAFTHDGRVLATADAKGVRLWDTATHLQINTIYTSRVTTSLAFSPDSRVLATTADGPTRFWDVSYLVDDLPQRLCGQASRSLTREEWLTLIPPGPPFRPICP